MTITAPDLVSADLQRSADTITDRLVLMTKLRNQSHLRSFGPMYGLIIISVAQLWSVAWVLGTPLIQQPGVASVLIAPTVVGVLGMLCAPYALTVIVQFRRRARSARYTKLHQALLNIEAMIAERSR